MLLALMAMYNVLVFLLLVLLLIVNQDHYEEEGTLWGKKFQLLIHTRLISS